MSHAAAPTTCGVNVGGLCGQPAVAVIVVRQHSLDHPYRFGRCAGHPAKSWLRIIRSAYPNASVYIEQLAGAR